MQVHLGDRLDRMWRELERHFRQNIGCTVVQFSLLLRLQHARALLIATELGIREVAAASGFNSLSHFSYSFSEYFGRRPSDCRQAWPEWESAPTWPGSLTSFLQTLQNRTLKKVTEEHMKKETDRRAS